MKNKAFYSVIALVAVLAIGTWAVGFSGPNAGTVFEGDCVECNLAPESTVEPVLGAFSGPDIFSDLNIYGSVTSGSNKLTATSPTAAANTLSFTDLDKATFFDIDNATGASNISWALPATSTMNLLLPQVGSSRSWTFRNASTTGSRTFTLTAGTGVDLQAPSNADDVIDANEYMTASCTRLQYRGANNVDVVCIVEELTAAD